MADPEELDVVDDEEIRCRLCNLKGKTETPFHMVTECLTLWRKRWEHFGHFSLEGDEHISWDPKTLVGFFRKIDLENKTN